LAKFRLVECGLVTADFAHIACDEIEFHR
jgi:hypothetical protein